MGSLKFKYEVKERLSNMRAAFCNKTSDDEGKLKRGAENE